MKPVEPLRKQIRYWEGVLYAAQKAGDKKLAAKAKRTIERKRKTIDRRLNPSAEEKARFEKKERAKEEKKAKKRQQQLQRQRQKAREAPSKPLKSRKPLVQAKPLPATNPTRLARLKEAQFSKEDGYWQHLKNLPCVRCGKPGPSDFAHMRGVDLGGTAEDGLPLCRTCHMWQETHKLQFNEEFTQRHGISPLEMAHAMRAAFLLQKGEQA